MSYFNQININPLLLYNFNNYYNRQPEISFLKLQSKNWSLESSIILGKSGSGVTHVLNAICNDLVKMNKKVMCITSQCFNYQFKKLKTEEGKESFKKQILTFDVIAVDNIQFFYRKALKLTQHFFDLLMRIAKSDKIILLGCSEPQKDISKSKRFEKEFKLKTYKLKELCSHDVYLVLKQLSSPEDQIPDKLFYAISSYNGMVQQHINCLISVRFNSQFKAVSNDLSIEQFDELFSLKKYFPTQQFRKSYIQTQLDFKSDCAVKSLIHDTKLYNISV